MGKFNYAKIDEVPEAFYDGVIQGNGFVALPNKKVQCTINGKPMTVNIQLNRTCEALWNRYEKMITGDASKDIVYYDPIDADEKFHENPEQYYDDYGRFRTVMEIAPGTAELTTEQVKKRILVFVKIMQMINDESVAEYIAQIAPKKKDGSFYLKRIVHIATCFYQRSDLQMQVLYAQAKKDNEILISSHLETHASVEKLEDDVVVTTDLFREI